MLCPLCDMTVTVYRRLEDAALPQILRNCHLSYRRRAGWQGLARREDTEFLLIAPPDADIEPGDRVIMGEGQECLWADLVPARIPGLCQVAYVKPVFLCGQISHIEAGR